ncbi:MAG TPA: DUF4861 family protein, partial [Paludibacteraceae bacterium]|nr:DUF4861 family protein [Paludibacteraceae bacterium]
MKKLLYYNSSLTLFLISLISGAQTVASQTVLVTNKSDKTLRDYTVEVPLSGSRLTAGNYVVVSSENEIVPLEISTDLKGDQKAIFPVADIKPFSTTKYYLKKGNADKYPKRTYAEIAHKIGGKFAGKVYEGGFSWVKPNYMRMPDNFTDHAYYIKYEGPGWESDKVAFRFYLDWRNGIDVFGKRTPGIVLPFVGTEDYEKYHHMADWGMDNMKVGNSLGLGSIAVWNGTKAVRVEKTDSVISLIPADGKIRSQVLTNYYGWQANGVKCNLKSLISIDAGSRASRMELSVDKNLPNIATGIVKDKNAELIKPEKSTGEWSYIATFGKQSLNNDMQGLTVFYRTKQLQKITEDELSH